VISQEYSFSYNSAFASPHRKTSKSLRFVGLKTTLSVSDI